MSVRQKPERRYVVRYWSSAAPDWWYIEFDGMVWRGVDIPSRAAVVSQDTGENRVARWSEYLMRDPKAVVQMVLVEDEPDPWGLSA